ncbi:MAG TPA: glycosyltransferase family 2 protein [Deltaproteobacteria bacterium]|nr:glycosyltransferase family 2 protein [Deltaproteobacteria bacterium]
MEGLSVTIITLNEEEDIGACLDSVAWADEVIVSDSGSTDRTVEICRERGARVWRDRWLGYGAQKNLCQSRASHRWILNVDADERVTPELREEIAAVLRGDRGGFDGYYIPRRNYFGRRWVRRCGWYPDHTLRLYRKDRGAYAEENAPHESVVVEGRAGYLDGALEHYSYSDVSDYIRRLDRYSTAAARDLHGRGRRAGLVDLALRPPLAFLKSYVLRLGFLEGALGLTLARLAAAYTHAKYAKLLEMEKGGL